MIRTRNAFTFMELLVVVILVGIVAAFAIPSYGRARERVDEREALDNLWMIISAMEIYRVRHEGYPTVDSPEVTGINTTLNLGIIEHNMDYSCDRARADRYRCDAVSPYGWEIRVEQNRDAPRCRRADCPTRNNNQFY